MTDFAKRPRFNRSVDEAGGAKIPNWFAYVAMFGWPLVCLAFFVRLPTEKAAIWSLLGGYMLLPSDWEVDAPLLPPMDKMAITAIATLLLCWMKGFQAPRPRRAILMYVFAAGLVLAPIFTSFNNSYELEAAGKSVHGFYPSDGLKFAIRNLMSLVPLYIGWRFLSTDNARTLLLKAIPSAMLVYSLPMLFEVRMSPQLHRWVYGYFPGDSFAQQIRAGGFRPVVFFQHGLALALFTALAVLAAVVVTRMKARILRIPAGAVAFYLSGLLILCKSLGPVIYAGVFAPLLLFTRPRLWVKVGCAASLVVCAYPLLRNNGLAPTQLVADVAHAVSKNRSASFESRVANEAQLLAKANQKPWFGWGGWGRNRIFDQWTGQDISVTDGGWIIQFGVYGWMGYLSLFGLLTLAQFSALRAMGKEVTPSTLARGGLAVLLAVYVIDSIPNATQVSLVFLLAGSIASVPLVRRRAGKRTPSARAETPSEELALAK